MGSLPYDDRHEDRQLVDCDVCSKRFLMYPDKVPTCTDCLQSPTTKRLRSRQDTPIAFLFDE